ncbi:glycerate kinase [Sinomonas sp. JGH33]|uniref:Glycerate kinase n=1 Tax=Sinomonas terricola TaxID=3110330 RepID=A0ABU5T2M5_9MICC|nr:glycerate kinase [Sinomonas sp. JGH33]MEA5453909.1 glycerate kinase [Sinomonas sp. JGH33]
MKIVLAPDKFKGTLTAPEVAEALAEGILEVLPEAKLVLVPVADGGEGTVSAALGAGFSPRRAAVSGPTGEPLTAEFALDVSAAGGRRRAVVEMAAASGLDVLPGGVKHARNATSLGTGQLIRAAFDAGAREIVLGVGGSACTDGGAGMLQGLGARFTDDAGNELPLGGAALARIAEADLGGLDARLDTATLILAADVDNPLLGDRGAAAVFGPQKGATPSDVAELDAALARFADVLGAALGPRAAAAKDAPGAGAAGGVGYAALALGAQRRRGIDVVVEFTGLREKLKGASLVVTGEGSLDAQSLSGKAPVGVAAEARAAGVPVVAVCGRSQLDGAARASAGFAAVHALTDLEADVDVCLRDARRLVRETGRLVAQGLRDSGTQGIGKGFTIVDTESRKESVR